MAIGTDAYEKLARQMIEVCNRKELQDFMSGDFSVVRKAIVDELMLVDYQGVFLDVVFEDLFTKKKRQILKNEFGDFADFLMSDLSLYLLKHNLSKILKP